MKSTYQIVAVNDGEAPFEVRSPVGHVEFKNLKDAEDWIVLQAAGAYHYDALGNRMDS